MIVLGVDPGSRVTGYGLVEKRGHQMTCLHAGTFGTSLNRPFFERIYEIFQSMTEIMNRFRPEEMAIEDLFFHKNLESAMKIGHARGAVLDGGEHLLVVLQGELRVEPADDVELADASL